MEFTKDSLSEESKAFGFSLAFFLFFTDILAREITELMAQDELDDSAKKELSECTHYYVWTLQKLTTGFTICDKKLFKYSFILPLEKAKDILKRLDVPTVEAPEGFQEKTPQEQFDSILLKINGLVTKRSE